MNTMKTVKRWAVAALALAALVAAADNGGTDPAARTAWGENVGWLNAAPAVPGAGVAVRYNGETGWLAGYAWCENVGWLKFGSDAGGPYANTTASDWGVNLGASGALSGYAWGENIGWVKFDTAHTNVTVNLASGGFAGLAWGENVGWLNFGGASATYGVRTLAFDTQPLGTPNWWLDRHGVTELWDEGDGVPASDEFVSDTDPNDAASVLRVTAVTKKPTAATVAFGPVSARRFYTLSRRDDLGAGASWEDVPGQSGVRGEGPGQLLQDTAAAPARFYRVRVSLQP
jgi:hypothetical protein